MELCTGGIIGLGETREQRLELTLELARLFPEEVTINILVPVPGTPLELQTDLPNSEIVRMFFVIRFLLPESVIKISGGRETQLDDSGKNYYKVEQMELSLQVILQWAAIRPKKTVSCLKNWSPGINLTFLMQSYKQ